MRLVRLDHLPGGRSLELHPRLTVLIGAPAEVTGALEHLLRSLVAGDPVAFDGQVELHGIRLGLHDRAFEMDGAVCVDPVLDLGAPKPLRPVRSGRQRRDEPRPVVDMRPIEDVRSPSPAIPMPDDPAQHTRRIASDDLIRLRAELRSLDGERGVLERRATEARAGLDSFARATLDVALGQLEAVEARQATASVERSTWHEERAVRRAELTGRIEALRTELGGLSATSADEMRAALDRLVGLRGPVRRLKMDAEQIADRLDALRGDQEQARAHRRVVEGRLADAEDRLVQATREAGDRPVEAAAAPVHDPDVVRMLESVRDQLYELEEGGHEGPDVENRLTELRSEEALLLDRLGFETYTSYVVGSAAASAAADEHRRREAALTRLRQARDDVERLRGELSETAGDNRTGAEREELLGAAADLLGIPSEGLSRLTTGELIDLLRSGTVDYPVDSAEIRDLLARMAVLLADAGVPPPEPSGDPEVVEELARGWLRDEPERAARRTQLVRALEEAERERAELDQAEGPLDDGGRGADLEAEEHLLRARVAECEERVSRHQQATAELADLRSQELELRDRERDLLVRISDRERLLAVLGVDVTERAEAAPAPVEPGGGASTDEIDSLRRRVERDASIAWPVDREWQLLARLGEIRSVGSVGSVPLIVSGVDVSSVDTPALLHRIASMSELVQLILCATDERVARWAGGLGKDARVVRW